MKRSGPAVAGDLAKPACLKQLSLFVEDPLPLLRQHSLMGEHKVGTAAGYGFEKAA
jgi:hypothetical protein